MGTKNDDKGTGDPGSDDTTTGDPPKGDESKDEPSPLAGILTGDTGSNDDNGSGDNDDTDLDGLVDAVVARLEGRLEQQFDRVADRRVNAIIKEIRKREDDDKGDGEKPPPPPESTGPSSAEVREARMGYREYVPAEIDFVSSDERALANQLASAAIVSRLGPDDDPDAIGLQVAREVAQTIKDLRASYERTILDRLKAKNLLVNIDGADGAPPAGGPQTRGAASDFQAGVQRAKELLGTTSD